MTDVFIVGALLGAAVTFVVVSFAIFVTVVWQLNQLQWMGGRLMDKVDELKGVLDDVLASLLETDKKVAEIGLDVDDLIGMAGGNDLQGALDKANEIKAKLQAVNDGLAATAAKHANPSEQPPTT